MIDTINATTVAMPTSRNSSSLTVMCQAGERELYHVINLIVVEVTAAIINTHLQHRRYTFEKLRSLLDRDIGSGRHHNL